MPHKFLTETLSQSHRLCFIGKERDSETGFSYFGARYYDSDILTGWLSVDPMADSFLYVRHSAINKSH
ncbi:MAG: hypothetical protein IKD33_04455 [Bacteroidales bacterium]|nr:hypothetical protein [Bacteroidales bacterium]